MQKNTEKQGACLKTPQTLAVVGASYLQLPLVLKAKEMGLRTICFAWEEGALCKEYADKFFPISVLEKEAITEVCQQEKIDGVTTIATDIAVPTIAHIATELNLIGNSVESAYISTNKYAMRQALNKAGVNCPRFALIKSLADAQQASAELSFPLIIKPCDRSGSMGVCKLDNADELKTVVAAALQYSFCKQAVLEEFVDHQREISIEGISFAGEYYPLAVTDKVTTGAPHYVEVGHHQPSDLEPSVSKIAIEQAKAGIDALQIKYGATHAELMITAQNEVHVTEIGARMGGDFIGSDLVQLSTGYDFLQATINVALNQFTKPDQKMHKCAGVWFYTPNTIWVKKVIENQSQYPEVIKAKLDDEHTKTVTRSADRAGYFVYSGNTKIKGSR